MELLEPKRSAKLLGTRSVRYKAAKVLIRLLSNHQRARSETNFSRQVERGFFSFALVALFPSTLLIAPLKGFLLDQTINENFLYYLERSGRASKWGPVNRFRLDLLYVVEELLLLRGRYRLAMSVVRAQWLIVANARGVSLSAVIAVGHSLGLFEEVQAAVCRKLRLGIPATRTEYLRVLLSGSGLIQEKKFPSADARWHEDVKDRQVFFAGPGLGTSAGFLPKSGRKPILVQIVNHRVSSMAPPAFVEVSDFVARAGYINGEYSRMYPWSTIRLVELGLDWIIFKSFGAPPDEGLHRFCFKPRLSFVRGSPHMAPVVVSDLWASGASSVYVTGISFHLGQKVYSDAYSAEKPGHEGGVGSVMQRAIAHHNPFENWGFMGFMQWAGFVEGDPKLLELLKLTPDEFAGRLESQFSSTK